MKIPAPVVFAMATALCWGFYGPVLAKARSTEKPPAYSPFKPYLGVGMAYFVLACVGGVIAMKLTGDSLSFAGKQMQAGTWGFAAGVLGALGALTLTLAMFTGGTAMPHVVMPIVFGGAVTVSAIVSVIQVGQSAKPSPLMWVGVAGILLCIVIVMSNTPHAAPPAAAKPASAPAK